MSEGPETSALRVKLITTEAGLNGLRGSWDQLWPQCAQATPFQSLAWLMPWWRSFGNERLAVLCFHNETGELVGILPLYRKTRDACTRVLPLGISSSDYVDGLLAPGWETRCATATWEFLAGWRGWDAVELPQLRWDSPLLGGALPRGLVSTVIPGEPCTSVPLPKQVQQLNGTLPRHIRENLSYYRRRAQRHGRMEIQIANAENLVQRFEEFVRLHQRRSQTKGLPGAFADSAVLEHHRAAVRALLSSGLLRLMTLHCHGRAIAAAETFADMRPGGCFYLYLTGFEADFSECSPGTLLIEEVLKQAIREQRRSVDFLRGKENYKRFWGAVNTPTFHRRISRA